MNMMPGKMQSIPSAKATSGTTATQTLKLASPDSSILVTQLSASTEPKWWNTGAKIISELMATSGQLSVRRDSTTTCSTESRKLTGLRTPS